MSKYKKVEKIGQGGHGDVYKGCNSVTGEEVFLQELRLPRDREGVPSRLIREISLLKEMDHCNIIRLMDVVEAEGAKCLYLVYEHMDTDLQKYIKTCPQVSRDPHMVFLQQILRAVSYYHSQNIFYLDLKLGNLFVDETNVLKLADYGFVRAFGGKRDAITYYTAPEILLKYNQYPAAVDMWSVGCMFAEMAIQRPLFSGPSVLDLGNIFRVTGTPNEVNWPGVTSSFPVVTGFPKIEPMDLAKEFPGLEILQTSGIDLLNQMLCVNPSKRITAADALNHAYFNNAGSETELISEDLHYRWHELLKLASM